MNDDNNNGSNTNDSGQLKYMQYRSTLSTSSDMRSENSVADSEMDLLKASAEQQVGNGSEVERNVSYYRQQQQQQQRRIIELRQLRQERQQKLYEISSPYASTGIVGSSTGIPILSTTSNAVGSHSVGPSTINNINERLNSLRSPSPSRASNIPRLRQLSDKSPQNVNGMSPTTQLTPSPSLVSASEIQQKASNQMDNVLTRSYNSMAASRTSPTRQSRLQPPQKYSSAIDPPERGDRRVDSSPIPLRRKSHQQVSPSLVPTIALQLSTPENAVPAHLSSASISQSNDSHTQDQPINLPRYAQYRSTLHATKSFSSTVSNDVSAITFDDTGFDSAVIGDQKVHGDATLEKLAKEYESNLQQLEEIERLMTEEADIPSRANTVSLLERDQMVLRQIPASASVGHRESNHNTALIFEKIHEDDEFAEIKEAVVIGAENIRRETIVSTVSSMDDSQSSRYSQPTRYSKYRSHLAVSASVASSNRSASSEDPPGYEAKHVYDIQHKNTRHINASASPNDSTQILGAGMIESDDCLPVTVGPNDPPIDDSKAKMQVDDSETSYEIEAPHGHVGNHTTKRSEITSKSETMFDDGRKGNAIDDKSGTNVMTTSAQNVIMPAYNDIKPIEKRESKQFENTRKVNVTTSGVADSKMRDAGTALKLHGDTDHKSTADTCSTSSSARARDTISASEVESMLATKIDDDGGYNSDPYWATHPILSGFKAGIAAVLDFDSLKDSEKQRTKALFQIWDDVEEDRIAITPMVLANNKRLRQLRQSSAATTASPVSLGAIGSSAASSFDTAGRGQQKQQLPKQPQQIPLSSSITSAPPTKSSKQKNTPDIELGANRNNNSNYYTNQRNDQIGTPDESRLVALSGGEANNSGTTTSFTQQNLSYKDKFQLHMENIMDFLTPKRMIWIVLFFVLVVIPLVVGLSYL